MSSTKQRGPSGSTVIAVVLLSISGMVLAARVTFQGKRLSALEHDVEKLTEFMPMVVEKEASGE